MSQNALFPRLFGRRRRLFVGTVWTPKTKLNKQTKMSSRHAGIVPTPHGNMTKHTKKNMWETQFGSYILVENRA